ncbi:hypothetical protein C8J56DRAFT_1075805 [Mycena floridula]|nr:hypothetical protein C8J56DRAFT_1164131 [Mycena floridula]KAJ7589319.1 hypothetical protein C8J56DRAFT_1075805 [Mycena floridula]
MSGKDGSTRYHPSSHICGMTSISISYDLDPPLGIDAEGLNRSRALRHPVRGDYVAQEAYTSKSTVTRKTSYPMLTRHTTPTYLRTAIAAARDQLGEELTRWRDAVGREEMGEGGGGARRRTVIPVIEFLGLSSGFSVLYRIGIQMVQGHNIRETDSIVVPNETGFRYRCSSTTPSSSFHASFRDPLLWLPIP